MLGMGIRMGMGCFGVVCSDKLWWMACVCMCNSKAVCSHQKMHGVQRNIPGTKRRSRGEKNGQSRTKTYASSLLAFILTNRE